MTTDGPGPADSNQPTDLSNRTDTSHQLDPPGVTRPMRPISTDPNDRAGANGSLFAFSRGTTFPRWPNPSTRPTHRAALSTRPTKCQTTGRMSIWSPARQHDRFTSGSYLGEAPVTGRPDQPIEPAPTNTDRLQPHKENYITPPVTI